MESAPFEPIQESEEDDLAGCEVFDPSEEPEDPPFDFFEPPSEEPPPPPVEPPLPSDEIFFSLVFVTESPSDVFFSEEAASLSEEAAFL